MNDLWFVFLRVYFVREEYLNSPFFVYRECLRYTIIFLHLIQII